METIIGYIKQYGDLSFEEKEISDVDSLVLCQLSYLKYDGLVPDVSENKPSVTIKELRQHPDYEKLFADERFKKDNKTLFEQCCNSKRFGELRLNSYVNKIFTQEDFQTQFSAVTFILGEGTLYVAYRGTDETFIGWKEDLNMAFIYPVPGQAYSVKYLNIVASRLASKVYVGGHSKGGNFAVYAAMKCKDFVQEKLVKIYCMDGPGFRPEVLKECNYESIRDRVVRILPQSSLVGRLLETDEQYKVIKSKGISLGQHNPFFWLIKNGDFVETPKTDFGSSLMKETINRWVYSQEPEQLKRLSDTMLSVVETTNTDNLIDWENHKKESMNQIRQAIKDLNEEDSAMVKQMMQALFTMAKETMKKDLGDTIKKAFSFFQKDEEKKDE